ncbi:NlpC/P60 family protein [Jatrophihabitans sp. DSM 45814]
MAKARITRSHRILACSALLASAVAVSAFALGGSGSSAGAAPYVTAPATPTAASSAPANVATPSAATPSDATPSTSGEVTTKIAALATANEKLTEQLNKAQIEVEQARVAATKANVAVQAAQRDRLAAQRALGSALAMQYKSSTFSQTASLFVSNSGQSYLDRVQTLEQLATHQSQVAQAAKAAAATVAATQQRAQQAVKTALSQQAQVAKQRSALQAQIGKYQSVLTTLTATARSAYYGSSNATPAEITIAVSDYAIGATPADITAIRTALAQLGKPYVWAAAGPDSFDCSGLTMVAWRAAGVSMPHLASDQQNMGTPVDKSQLRPGDLVFFGSPAYHVALYMGSGMVIQAPNSGDVVKISPLAGMSSYSSATRLG